MAQPHNQSQGHSLQKLANAFLPGVVASSQPTSLCCSPSVQPLQDVHPAGAGMVSHSPDVQQLPCASPEEQQDIPAKFSGPSGTPGVGDMAARRIPWALSDKEKEAYDNIFRAWDDLNTGYFHGDKALQAFAASGLPIDDLALIWTLADVDNRGLLNIEEFQVAMGLIYRRLNGISVPYQLPVELALRAHHLHNGWWEAPTFQDAEKLVRGTPSQKPMDGQEESNGLSMPGNFEEKEKELVPVVQEDKASTWKMSTPRLRPPPQPLSPLKPLPPLPFASPVLPEDLQVLEDRVKKLSDELAYLSPGVEEAETRRCLEEELVSLIIGKIPEAKRKLRTTAESQPTKAGTGAGVIRSRRPPPPPPIDRQDLLLRQIRAGKKLRPTQTTVKSSPSPAAPASPSTPTPCLKSMTSAERQAFARHEAQYRIQKRMAKLGVTAPSASPAIDTSVEDRLQQEKKEAEERVKAEERERTRNVLERLVNDFLKVLQNERTTPAPPIPTSTATDPDWDDVKEKEDSDDSSDDEITQSRSACAPIAQELLGGILPRHASAAPGASLMRSIQGGMMSRPTKTVDKGASLVSGKVLGDIAPPAHINNAPRPVFSPRAPTPTPTAAPPPPKSRAPLPAKPRGPLLRSIRAGTKLRPTQTAVTSSPSPLGNVLGDARRFGHEDSVLCLISRPPPPPPTMQARVSQEAITDTTQVDADCAHQSVDAEAASWSDLLGVEGQSLSSSAPTENEDEEYVIV